MLFCIDCVRTVPGLDSAISELRPAREAGAPSRSPPVPPCAPAMPPPGCAPMDAVCLPPCPSLPLPSQDKNTPLHLAAYNGHDAACRVLVDAGADVMAVDRVSLCMCVMMSGWLLWVYVMLWVCVCAGTGRRGRWSRACKWLAGQGGWFGRFTLGAVSRDLDGIKRQCL